MRIDQKLIEEGYIDCKKHPVFDLFIYNYTPKCQIEKKWNEDTLKCRGLILDLFGNVVSRPFKKFFNYEEIQFSDYVPSLKNSLAFEKMDGSLGILYQVEGKKYIATRGSFSSPQAIEGTMLLRSGWDKVKFLPQYTYLFEIIYPQNRIVIDYHGISTLILLAIIDNHTGKDMLWRYVEEFATKNSFLMPDCDYFEQWDRMKELQLPNREGFVVLCEDGTRVKIKFDEYKRLHRIVTGVSSKSIWDCLRNNQNIQEYIYNVPDEFAEWVIEKQKELFSKYRDICEESKKQILNMKSHGYYTMKDKALYIQKHPYKSVIFAMVKGYDYSQIVWKLIEPEYEQPFSNRRIYVS